MRTAIYVGLWYIGQNIAYAAGKPQYQIENTPYVIAGVVMVTVFALADIIEYIKKNI